MTYSRALQAQRQLGLGSGFLGHRDDILGLGGLDSSNSVSECSDERKATISYLVDHTVVASHNVAYDVLW